VKELACLLVSEWLDAWMVKLLEFLLMEAELVPQLLGVLWVIWLELPWLVEELALELGLVERLGKV